MTKHLIYFSVGLFLCLLTTVQNSIAQQTYEFAKGGTIAVNGTSSLHDWQMQLNAYKSALSIELYADSIIIFPSEVTALATGLKSDSKLMDKKAYSALKTDDNNQIKFEILKKQKLIFNGQNERSISGRLTVSGVSKNVVFSCNLEQLESNLQFSGELDAKMSDFGVKAPTALMGTIKTSDDVKILYNLIVQIVE